MANFGPGCNIRITLLNGEVSGIGADPKSGHGGYGIIQLPKQWNSSKDDLFVDMDCEPADASKSPFVRFDEQLNLWVKDTSLLEREYAESNDFTTRLSLKQQIRDIEVFHIDAANRSGWAYTDKDRIVEEEYRRKWLGFCLLNPPMALCGGGHISSLRDGKRGDLTPHVLKILRSIEFLPDKAEAPTAPANTLGERLLPASDATHPSSAAAPTWGAGLVPKGFHVLETIRGDLNHDGQDDVVLIVKATNPAKIVTDANGHQVDRNRRGLVIAFRDHDGYRLALMNPTLVSSENEDGGVYFPPELSVRVEKGTLVLHYAHGRYGYWRYKFRYQQDQFVLIGYDRSDDRGPVVETFTSINLSTGKKLKKVNINSDGPAGDERFVEHWSLIVVPKPITLSDIADLADGSVEKALGER